MRRQTRLHLPMGECRECHDPIRFVKLDTSRLMPVNPGVNPAGTVAAWKAGDELRGYVISQAKPHRANLMRFTPHFATCTAREHPAPRIRPAAPDPLF